MHSYIRGVNFFNSNTEIQRFDLSEDDAVRQLSDGDETNFKVRIPGGIVETGISILLRKIIFYQDCNIIGHHIT